MGTLKELGILWPQEAGYQRGSPAKLIERDNFPVRPSYFPVSPKIDGHLNRLLPEYFHGIAVPWWPSD